MPVSPLILAAIAGAAGACAGIALGIARRRSRRSRALDLGPGPAGMRHLATRVSELSDTGLHLPPRSDALHGKHRLGVLLGLR
jgi:hypothetical protein